MKSIYQALSEIEANNDSAALCTVVKSEGSTPRHVGSKMLVYPDGKFIGTVGGGGLENRVMDEARKALADGQPRHLHYNMSDPSRGDVGVCGGQVEVFVEPILPAPMVIVIGAGHVGKAVAHLAKWLGFRVAVSDDRAEFCNAETVPEADAYYPVPMEKLTEHVKVTRQTYLVLTTRGSNGRGGAGSAARNGGSLHRRHRVEAQVGGDGQSAERAGSPGGEDRARPLADWAGVAGRNARGDRGQHHGGNFDDPQQGDGEKDERLR